MTNILISHLAALVFAILVAWAFMRHAGEETPET